MREPRDHFATMQLKHVIILLHHTGDEYRCVKRRHPETGKEEEEEEEEEEKG